VDAVCRAGGVTGGGHTTRSQRSATASVAAQDGLFTDPAVALSKALYFCGNARTASAGRPSAATGGPVGLSAAPVAMPVISARRNRSLRKLSKLSTRMHEVTSIRLKRRCRGAIGGHREDHYPPGYQVRGDELQSSCKSDAGGAKFCSHHNIQSFT